MAGEIDYRVHWNQRLGDSSHQGSAGGYRPGDNPYLKVGMAVDGIDSCPCSENAGVWPLAPQGAFASMTSVCIFLIVNG